MILLFLCLMSYFYGMLVYYIITRQHQIIDQTYNDCRKKTMNLSKSFIVFLSACIFLFTRYMIHDCMDQIVFIHLAFLCLILAIIDYNTFYILDRTLLMMLVLAFVYLFYHDLFGIERLFQCGVQAFLFFCLTRIIKQGLGGGDIKLCLIASLLLSYQSYYGMVLLAIHLALIEYLIRFLKKQEIKQTYLAFGPYLAFSFLVFFYLSM